MVSRGIAVEERAGPSPEGIGSRAQGDDNGYGCLPIHLKTEGRAQLIDYQRAAIGEYGHIGKAEQRPPPRAGFFLHADESR